MKLTKKQLETINTLKKKVDEANLELHNYLEEVIEEFEAWAAERSEKWQESDAAQEHQDKIDCLRDGQDLLQDAELEFDLEVASS